MTRRSMTDTRTDHSTTTPSSAAPPTPSTPAAPPPNASSSRKVPTGLLSTAPGSRRPTARRSPSSTRRRRDAPRDRRCDPRGRCPPLDAAPSRPAGVGEHPAAAACRGAPEGVRPAPGAPGGLRAPHDARDGQAPRRGERRGHLRGRVPPLVLRGGRPDRRLLRHQPRGLRPGDRDAQARRADVPHHPPWNIPLAMATRKIARRSPPAAPRS